MDDAPPGLRWIVMATLLVAASRGPAWALEHLPAVAPVSAASAVLTHAPERATSPPAELAEAGEADDDDAPVEGSQIDQADAAEADEELATLLDPRWHALGPVSAECVYFGEAFNNTRGGLSTRGATRYRGNLDLTLGLDTEAAGWWTAGAFCVYLQQTHGRTLTADFVGDGQYYSSLDTGRRQDITQVGECWYEHAWDDDALVVRLGRQDSNEHFAYADLGADFLNSSFTTLPNVAQPTWPYQALGAMALYRPSERLRLGGGVYDHGRDHAMWWSTTTGRGLFFISQADFQPLADEEKAPLTLLRLGGWLATSDTVSIAGDEVFQGNYGLYATADHMLLPEADDAEQGFGAFGQVSWAPADRNEVDWSWGGGLLYRGLLPSRGEDTLGLGITRIGFSSHLREEAHGPTSEDAIELFYKARVGRWLSVQPDLQYIARPSGVERDALVAGLRFEARL